MSLDNVRKVVDAFISSDSNDFVLIKGGWGVGKTYFWNQCINEAKTHKTLAPRYYSYVSLFGINSLEELKNTLFASRVDLNNVDENKRSKNISENVEHAKHNLLSKGKQLFSKAENIPKFREWTGGLLSTYMFLNFKKTLICFDDYERKSDKLEIKELLGLISLLKEQQDCKIVFIMNDCCLLEEDAKEFKTHSEKICDIEIEFSPSSTEIVNYIFNSSTHHDLIEDCCVKLNLKNIRILQRIKRYIEGILPILANAYPTVIEDVLRSLILYCWSYYDKSDNVPPLSYINNYNYISIIFKEDKEFDVATRKWNEILKRYGYDHTNKLDEQLLLYVQSGYYDTNVITEILAENFESINAKAGKHAFEKSWDIYHNSFNDNEDEFVRELVSSFNNNIKYMSFDELQSAVRVLRNLEMDDLANSLADNYFNNHTVILPVHYQLPSTINSEIQDTYILEKLQKDFNESFSLEEIVKKIALQQSWNRQEILYLSRLKSDDFYNYFKAIDSNFLTIFVKACLNFEEYANGRDELMLTIANTVKDALRKIGSENRFNKLRVKAMYGVDVEQAFISKQ